MVTSSQQLLFGEANTHNLNHRMYFGLAYVLCFDPEEDQLPLRDYLLWILISLLFVFGILHGSYILLVTKRDNEVIEKSWHARMNGWVFEQQYVAFAVSEGVMDQGLQVEVQIFLGNQFKDPARVKSTWEDGVTTFPIKKGGVWNGDATVTNQAGDNIHNSTPYVATPVRKSPESRLSTQLTANPTSPKDNSFFIAKSDLFDGRGSSDTYEEPHRELLETRAALKSANSSLTILDHNYKKLWATQEEELRKAQAEIQHLLERNRHLNKELATVKLMPKVDLASRIENLKFPECPDRVEPSTVQLSQKVIDLNEEIFQFAATVGEMMVPRGGMHAVSSEEMASAFQKSRKLLGSQMTIVLAAEAQNRHKNVNPMLAQVVLQIAITRWCANLISIWKPWDEKVDEVLNDVYSGIRKLGNQRISGTWRSLTRSQWHSPNQDWVTNFTDDLSCIFHTAGWTTRNQDEEYQFEKRLPAILKFVHDIRVALGEDVISADIEIAVIEPGTPFSSKLMKNNYDDGKDGSISGTTGMGLRRIVMENTSGGDGLARDLTHD
ncbi:uncharacterized protein LACBIDRAFT_295342 [Laccaria bicolor S238N-H82]|uniref:Predicted protein n=1 Tax=Laccaria bicolor (strain S238N-H82 / ATCC MYA-4686) TaxID=486041 RepID=B0DQU0_LACBS|nr:uncharacterized protein LACBIDRAFT_295342 [Laccaria bicolor S238N-H82]EDR03088.1 predicted protein [Laccaria bicolor S238N-H82]|eukprot:XP_001886229.1 predicted protein [Laccaria bicolor S238N-H82]